MTSPSCCHIAFTHADQRDALLLWRALESQGVHTTIEQVVGGENGLPTDRDIQDGSHVFLVVSSMASRASLAMSAALDAHLKRHGRDKILPVIASTVSGEQSAEDVFSSILTLERRPGDQLLEPATSVPHPVGDLRKDTPETVAEHIREFLGYRGSVSLQAELANWSRRPVLAWASAGVATAAALLLALNASSLRSDNGALELAAHNARQSTARMFAELEDSLSAVARQEVFTQLGDELIASMDRSSGQPSESLLENARLLHVVGRMRVQEGDIEGALDAYTHAAEATQAVLSTEPDNPEYIYEHAQSVFWIGDAAVFSGRYDLAEAQYHAYADLAARLVSIDNSNPVYRAEWAYAQSNLGIASTGYDERQQALSYFQAAIAGYEDGLIDAGVVSEASLANAYGLTAGPLRSLGRTQEAIEARTAEIDIIRRLLDAAPSSRRHKVNYVNAVESRAHIYLDLGDIDLVERDIAIAAPIIAELRSEYPTDRSIRRHYLDIEMIRARLALYQGNLARAQLISSAAARDYASGDGAQLEDGRHVDLGRHDLLRAEIALTAGAYESALTAATQAAADFESDIDSEGSRLRHFAAMANFYRGEAFAALGNQGEAERAWRTGLAQVQALIAPRDPRADDVAARLMYRLGDREAAENIRDRIRSSGYARPDFLAFWQSPDVPVTAEIYESVRQNDG